MLHLVNVFALHPIKAVREKMGEAVNATVSNLDLSDVSDKTILFVGIGSGKTCNQICSAYYSFLQDFVSRACSGLPALAVWQR